MVEILGQTTPKLLHKQVQNYLRFVSQDISMAFIVKIAYNMKIVKIAKLTKIYGRNPKSGIERNLLTLTTLKNAVANILANSRKISISSSTAHETTTKTSPYVWIMYCCVGLT